MKKLFTIIPLLLLLASTNMFAMDCDSLSNSFTDSVSGFTLYCSNSVVGGSYFTYSIWDFGDGAMGYGDTTDAHTYATYGTYTVSFTTYFTDGAGDTCVHTTTHSVVIGSGAIDCGSLSTSFTDDVSLSTASFASAYSPSSYYVTNFWDFGDGTSLGYGTTPTHTYTADGTYTVTLTTTWVSGADTCIHTATGTVTTPTYPPSEIYGNIYGPNVTDSTESVYVWLITYDSTSGILTAIDSQYASVSFAELYTYDFTGVPAGDYRIKAAIIGAAPGTSGYIPTYDTASAYWSGATVCHHLAHTTDNTFYINMQYGTVTSGPGFIGGSVSAGAGKATDAGVANMLVYLRDAANHVVTYVYTDATGAYSFSGIATGTYNVYPEALNYATTPSATITLTATAPSSTDNNFRESTTLYTIKPVTTAVNNVTAANNVVKIFPNPATGTLHILWTAVDNNKHISVTDVTGRELISTNADNTTAQKDLDISSLAKGVYIVHIISANVDTTQKLVVE